MQIYLCGGRKYNGKESEYWDFLRNFVVDNKITQILFIGTAAETHPGPLALQFFKEKVNLPEKVKILDAEIESEIMKSNMPLVYVLGGHRQTELLETIRNRHQLENIIRTCPYYFGESVGAKLIGSKLRIGEPGTPLVDGLGILKNTVIEGHYTQKHREQDLNDEVVAGKLKYGLGIDEDAQVITTPESFPQFDKLGPGLVKLITS